MVHIEMDLTEISSLSFDEIYLIEDRDKCLNIGNKIYEA